AIIRESGAGSQPALMTFPLALRQACPVRRTLRLAESDALLGPFGELVEGRADDIVIPLMDSTKPALSIAEGLTMSGEIQIVNRI
ncbi:MAG: hypothetical protein AAB369_03940, partial [Chloroflexota bacterium]